MRTFKLFNFNMRSSAKVQADGCTAARQKIGVNPTGTPTFARFASGLCLILTMLFTLGVGEMKAYVNGSAYLYFTPDGKWSYTKYYFAAIKEHDSWQTQVYEMNKIAHTNLYYLSTTEWNDADYITIGAQNGSFSGGYWGYDSFKSYITMCGEKSSWGLNYQNTYSFKPSANTKGTSINATYHSGGYSNFNNSQTVKKYTCTYANDGSLASHYTEASINSGTVTISAYKMTGNGTASNSSNSATLDEASETSASTDAAYTGEVTLTASANTGYTFIGWFASTVASTALSTSTSYTYNATNSTKTVYARFKENRYDIKVLAASPSAGGSSPSPSGWTTTGQATGGTISITESTGYNFSGWTISSGSGTFANTSALSTTFYPSAQSELRPTFTAKTYTVTLDKNGGSSNGSATATYHSTTLSDISAPTRASYDVEGYYTSGGTKVANADGTLCANVSSYTNSSSQWIYDDDATLYAHWTYNPVTYTVNFGRRSGQDSSYGSVTAKNTSTEPATNLSNGGSVESGSSIEVTATPAEHYKLEGWYNAFTGGSLIDGAGTTNPYTYILSGNTKTYASFVIKTCTITLNKNGGSSGATSVTATHGSTLPSFSAHTRTNYTLTGYYTESSGGTKIIDASGALVASTAYANSSKQWNNDATALTLYAQWEEKMTTVTINASPTSSGTFTVGGAAFAEGNTTTAGVATSRTVVATAQPGYKFSSWSVSGNATGTNTTNTYTLKGNGSGSTGTLTANFDRLYAYVEGRFQVKNAARSSTTTTYASGGQWNESSTNIQMEYDNTNHRFALHTHMTPLELTATHGTGCDDCKPYFYIKTSTSNSSLAGVTSYMCTSAQTLTTAGSANGKTVSSSSGSNSNLRFNSSTASGYAVVYFNQSKIWYELEQRLQYNGNGSTSGSAPTGATGNNTYYATGTNATAAANTYTKTNYTFGGWNTNQYITGTNYAAGATNVTMSADVTLYAKWTRSVTLNQNGATTNGSTSVTATYNCATLPSITAPSKNGYTFGGWYTANDGSGSVVINTSGALQASKSGWTDGSSRFTRTDAAATLYAKWTQTITLNANTSYYGSGSNTSATVILNKTALSSITHCTPATGYHLVGYYTANTGGTKVLNANGTFADSNVTDYITSSKWTKAGATTLYAHYEPNTYTIAFNANDANYIGTATGSTASMENVEYDEEVNLTSNGFSRAHYTFAGWATTPTGAVAYSNGQEVSNLSSTNGATVTLYAKWTGDTYTVSFNQGAGTCPTSSTTVQYGSTYGSGSGLGGNMPTATAPGGYVFSGWFDAPAGGRLIEKDSVVTATTDHTLYARYTKQDRVYFYNNLGWTDVYVTYDAYWDNDNGTGNYEKIYHHMTRMGSSNIWYDDIPTSVLSSWKYFIAFNSKQLGAVGESSNWGNFDSGEAVYRYDFDSYATMFVPKTGDTWKKNNDKCTYQSSSSTYDAAEGIHGKNYRHSTGYWVRYNETKCGYAITGTWDSWANTTDFQAENAGDDTYIVTKTLAANTTYDFLLYKDYSTNSYNHIFTYTAATITSGSCTNKSLTTNGTKYSELETHHTKITTTAAGEYVFKLTPGTDGVLKLSVEYPFAVNDYRVTYNWNDGSAHSHSSEIIKAAAGTNETISVFVHKAANVKSQSLKIEKCTAINGSGVATWTAGNTIALPSEEITANGVYNFIITQPASGNPTGAFWNKYDGNYYIRTESSDGGWNYYKDYEDNIMTYSDYSLTQTLSDPYSHYYCRYIENCGMDITYQIATDYSSCVSDVFVGDATIGGAGNKTLPSGNPASIRFSWNEQTNAMRRAYLKSAQGAGNSRYLVLHGSDNKVRNNDATGTEISASGDLLANELQFTDNGNWVYQVSLKAMPGAKVCLIAKYNGSDRYLVGDGDDDWLTILGGTGSSKYEIAAVYDFKTNRLMTAWTPSGAISDKLKDVDLMLIRHAQEAATSVTFSGSGSLEAKKVIGALRMDYNELFGHVAGWTSSSRPLLKFFISFPFDVYVSDVFGLNSAYGDAYVIQRYAGDERAEKGFFRGDGTTSFWTDLTTADTLHANVGYCVILDNDYFNGDLGSIWQNKSAGSSVYLYFPSAGDVGNIESNEKTITIPPHECTINRTFGSGKNHKNTDSHWNLMGVPIFNNHTGSSTAGTPGAIFVTTGDQDKDCHYFYEWNSSNNQFSIRAALGYVFKSMHSYMVQYTGDVTFTGSAIVPASIAARRAPMNKNYNIELQVLNSDAEMLNRTYVELREEACDTFALNEDVYMSTNTNAVNIYTFTGNYDVAANVLSVNNHSIPVGLNVRTAGTYTITMPSVFSGTAILYDKQTDERTNLAISNYEVELPTGVINDRFVLEIDDINEIVTDIDFTTGEGSLKDGKAHKFIQNGLLYILQNGVIYDAQGKRVQ